MGCGKATKLVQLHLSTDTTTSNYQEFTAWMPAIGIDSVKVPLKVSGSSGNFRVQLAIQTADVRTDKPNAWARAAASDDYQQGDGEKATGLVSVSSATAGKAFVRFGLQYNLSAGSTLGYADVASQVTFNACGEVVGTASKRLQTPDSTNTQYEPYTDWIPAVQADKVSAAIVATGFAGNFSDRLAYQTADTSVESPNAWTNLEAGFNSTSGSRNTGELTLTLGTATWVRFGIASVLTSGTNGAADVSAMISVRRT